MATVKFLQFSDLHLGARLAWLPRDRRAERRREQQRALERAVEIAIDRRVHAILVPGDLFDDVHVDAENLAVAIDAFRATHCPPVFIAPGNHDPYSESSATWGDRMLAARSLHWPAHVHIFGSPHWTSVRMDDLPVRVWGRSFTPGMASTARPLAAEALATFEAPSPTELQVAVFHGSLEGRTPPGQHSTAPFTLEEAAQAPFAWMAVGHYHGPLVNAHFGYAGSLVALDATETGGRGALEVKIEVGAGPATAAVEALEVDPRRAHAIDVDVTGAASADQIDRRIAAGLERAGMRDQDFAKVRLTGRLAHGVAWSSPGDDVSRRYWHVRADASALRPDWDLDRLRQASDETTEGRFARVLLERLDSESDPGERATIERALYYGLDAFRLGEVAPKWEEIGS